MNRTMLEQLQQIMDGSIISDDRSIEDTLNEDSLDEQEIEASVKKMLLKSRAELVKVVGRIGNHIKVSKLDDKEKKKFTNVLNDGAKEYLKDYNAFLEIIKLIYRHIS